MKKLLFICIIIVCYSCEKDKSVPKQGTWRAVLNLDHNKEIPFSLNYSTDNKITILNGEETIEVKDVLLKGDSIIINMPVFESVFKGVYTSDSIYGDYIKPNLKEKIPFKMKQGRAERFAVSSAPTQNVSGSWETVFIPKSSKDRYIAKGIFEQIGHKVTGTFRTTTGDYRFLEGSVEKDSLRLSTFDGAHAFLFEALVTDSTMTGMFYSGNKWKEPFTAVRNENYELPKSDSLTFLMDGYENLEFSFKNTKGEVVSLTDDQFKNKVVIVQIMGTWCPNCMDESKFYSKFYEENKSKNLAFVSLAFEYAKTEDKAMAAINKFKEALNIPYPILLAQYGTTDKKKANKKLPMLNHIPSYPTTIFIGKDGKVRKIHTGFNGPATKGKYEDFKKSFSSYVSKLLAEE